MAWLGIAYLCGLWGNTNNFAEDGDKPLTSKQIDAADQAQKAFNKAGDPGQYYQEPYTGFLRFCCSPTGLPMVFDKAKNQATLNTISDDIGPIMEKMNKFADQNNIDVKSGAPKPPSQPDNPFDEALFATGNFFESLKTKV